MHYLLIIFIFTVYQGHGLADATYRDRIEIGPFLTEADCLRAIPQVRFESFARTHDLSYDMHEVRCAKVIETGAKK